MQWNYMPLDSGAPCGSHPDPRGGRLLNDDDDDAGERGACRESLACSGRAFCNEGSNGTLVMRLPETRLNGSLTNDVTIAHQDRASFERAWRQAL